MYLKLKCSVDSSHCIDEKNVHFKDIFCDYIHLQLNAIKSIFFK